MIATTEEPLMGLEIVSGTLTQVASMAVSVGHYRLELARNPSSQKSLDQHMRSLRFDTVQMLDEVAFEVLGELKRCGSGHYAKLQPYLLSAIDILRQKDLDHEAWSKFALAANEACRAAVDVAQAQTSPSELQAAK
jgi:hypothetical protein